MVTTELELDSEFVCDAIKESETPEENLLWLAAAIAANVSSGGFTAMGGASLSVTYMAHFSTELAAAEAKLLFDGPWSPANAPYKRKRKGRLSSRPFCLSSP